MANDKTISNQTVNFQGTKIALGSKTFQNTDTNLVTAVSAEAKDSEATAWTWTQADPTKFTISYAGAELAIADATKSEAAVTVGSGNYTYLPAQYYAALVSQWTTAGWVKENNTGAIYGPTDQCAALKEGLGELIIRIDDFDFVIPSIQYYKDLTAAKTVSVAEGTEIKDVEVNCQIDYFTTGSTVLELGFNFFSDFELIADNTDGAATLSFRAGSKISNNAQIRDSGAFAALSASFVALASTLLF